jgi:hypothetical protein
MAKLTIAVFSRCPQKPPFKMFILVLISIYIKPAGVIEPFTRRVAGIESLLFASVSKIVTQRLVGLVSAAGDGEIRSRMPFYILFGDRSLLLSPKHRVFHMTI